ncbi:MAG: hypothetical protein LBS00_10845 [Synergistaceae bacterium]|jgi:hypothetical protein|nr:hypothetical protein [Synergistaceae bacterium]
MNDEKRDLTTVPIVASIPKVESRARENRSKNIDDGSGSANDANPEASKSFA